MHTTTHRSLFASKEEYLAFTRRWKELARAKQLTAQDCLMRALLLQQDLSRVMPMTKNPRRLASGAANDSGLVRAAQHLRSCNPLRDFERRAARAASLTAAGQVVPAFLSEPTWAERWVDPGAPASNARGLSLETFQRLGPLADQAHKAALSPVGV